MWHQKTPVTGLAAGFEKMMHGDGSRLIGCAPMSVNV